MPNIKDIIRITSSISESVWMTLCDLNVAVGESFVNVKESLRTKQGERYMADRSIKTIGKYGQMACSSNYGDLI